MIGSTTVRLSAIVVAGLLSLSGGSAGAQSNDLAVTDTVLVSSQRVGRTFFDYTYTITVSNAGPALENVVARVSSTSSATVIQDDTVTVGSLGANASESSSDTFTFRQNRRIPFDPTALTWSFSYDQPPAGVNAPQIVSVPPTRGRVGEPYAYTVAAVDPDAGDTVTYSLLESPPGMAVDPVSGVVNWLPPDATPADVIAVATDSAGLQDAQLFTVLVSDAGDDPPVLDPIPDQEIAAGRTLLVATTAADPEGQSLSFSLTSAPAGMAINKATGEIQWTPDVGQAGSHPAAVRVDDPGGNGASQAFTVTVLAEANAPPALEPVADVSVAVNEALTVQLSAADPDPDDPLRFGLDGAPTSVQFDPASGRLHWVPEAPEVGTYPLTARVTDSAGASDAAGFTIRVLEAPQTPVANDDRYSVGRNSVLEPAVGVLDNDTDGNFDPLTAIQQSDVILGSLPTGLLADGSFVYQPPGVPAIDVGIAEQCRYNLLASGTGSHGGTPAVADIDADGLPELVLVTTQGGGYFLLVFDLRTCAEERRVSLTTGAYAQAGRLSAKAHPGLANLDSDPELEIVVPAQFDPTGAADHTHLIALEHDGSFKWRSQDLVSIPQDRGKFDFAGPAFADLDADGSPEILIATTLRNATGPVLVVAYDAAGRVLWEATGGVSNGQGLHPVPVHVADLDLDGGPEIVAEGSVFSAAGTLLMTLPANVTQSPAQPLPGFGGTAVANMDTDPFAEIVIVNPAGFFVFSHDGALQTFSPVGGIGPVSVGDYDGDGLPEVAQVNRQLFVFEHDGTRRWQGGVTATHDFFSNQGEYAVAGFDFDLDGAAEIVMSGRNFREQNNQRQLFVWQIRGDELVVLDQFHDPAIDNFAFGIQVFPTVADVDDDDAAEIVLVGTGALMVFEGLPGNPWPATRPIRNQWSYKASSVLADGTVPSERPYWLIPGLNEENGHPLIPGEDPGASDGFTYLASDGSADSDVASVHIAITPGFNVPLIVSTPLTGGSPGFPYRYGVLAIDADAGDELSYSLARAPQGMTIDDFTGIIEWLPDQGDLGDNLVHVIVVDAQGNTGSQQFRVSIAPPVTVPDLAGLNDMAAADAVTGAALAVGTVSRRFSTTVPAGQVISQSEPAGGESPAGNAIDYVISLGPRPVFVPDLVGASELVAAAQLGNLGLTPGPITRVNDPQAPLGAVVGQAPAAGTQTSPGAAVSLTVSGGPAVSIGLERDLLVAGSSSALTLAFFDLTGAPLASPSDLAVSVAPQPGSQGGLPTASSSLVSTSGNTRGAYTLRVQAPSRGIDASTTFAVSASAADVHAAYAELSQQLNDLGPAYQALTRAIVDGDTAAVQSQAATLQNLADALDLEALSLTPALAPEVGFAPDSLAIPGPTDGVVFPQRLGNVILAVRSLRNFLDSLSPSAGRDDDVRAQGLNRQLDAAAGLLEATGESINGYVSQKAALYQLMSVEIPSLVRSDIQRTLAALRDAGLIAAVAPPPSISRLYGDTQPAFFSLAGITSASGIRSAIVQNLYRNILVKLSLRGTILVADGLIDTLFDVGDLETVITGASQSFHIFDAPNSVLESRFASALPDANIVYVVGPDLPAGISSTKSKVDGILADPPQNLSEAKEAVETIVTELKGALGGAQRVVVDESLRGCLFSSSPDCRQLVFHGGFPSVHSDGAFPAQVLVFSYNAENSSMASLVANFFPKPAE